MESKVDNKREMETAKLQNARQQQKTEGKKEREKGIKESYEEKKESRQGSSWYKMTPRLKPKSISDFTFFFSFLKNTNRQIRDKTTKTRLRL